MKNILLVVCAVFCIHGAVKAQKASQSQKIYTYKEAVKVLDNSSEFTSKGSEVVEQIPSVGEQIYSLRTEKNVSLSTLAFVAGLKTEILTKIEKNQIVPTRDIIARIEEFFGAEVVLANR